MNNKLIPTHPGEILKEELETRHITQKEFSELTSINYTMLNEVLNCRRAISSEFALIMEASLGINPELLINMQNRYNIAVARQRPAFNKRLSAIRQSCASVLL